MTEREFETYWELLCERYGKTLSSPLVRLYAVTIRGEGLSGEEWGRAVAQAIRHNDFMPSIQKLIDYARPGFKAQALSEWDACLNRARAGEVATLPGTPTRTLMQSVTNGRPLGEVPQERLEWVKREFLERYTALLGEQAAQRTPALIPAPRRVLGASHD